MSVAARASRNCDATDTGGETEPERLALSRGLGHAGLDGWLWWGWGWGGSGAGDRFFFVPAFPLGKWGSIACILSWSLLCDAGTGLGLVGCQLASSEALRWELCRGKGRVGRTKKRAPSCLLPVEMGSLCGPHGHDVLCSLFGTDEMSLGP